MKRMAKRRNDGRTALLATAEGVGTALGHLSARIRTLKQQRAEIAADLQQLLRSARGILDDLGHAPAAAGAARRRGGRPPGYKLSDATRARLRAAWRRRKAAAARAAE
jgi:hypothetical protein